MTSWEHGVLAVTDPGLKLGLQTTQFTGSTADRWLRRAWASVLRCVAASPRGSNGSAARRRVSPFVWIGREKVQSLLRWAGLFSQNSGRQAGRALLPPNDQQCLYHYNSNYIGFLYILDCYRFGIGRIHNACFVWEKAQLIRNTLRTGFHSWAPHFTHDIFSPFFRLNNDTKVQIYLRTQQMGSLASVFSPMKPSSFRFAMWLAV